MRTIGKILLKYKNDLHVTFPVNLYVYYIKYCKIVGEQKPTLQVNDSFYLIVVQVYSVSESYFLS
jgi:hypothetical protein